MERKPITWRQVVISFLVLLSVVAAFVGAAWLIIGGIYLMTYSPFLIVLAIPLALSGFLGMKLFENGWRTPCSICHKDDNS